MKLIFDFSNLVSHSLNGAVPFLKDSNKRQKAGVVEDFMAGVILLVWNENQHPFTLFINYTPDPSPPQTKQKKTLAC